MEKSRRQDRKTLAEFQLSSDCCLPLRLPLGREYLAILLFSAASQPAAFGYETNIKYLPCPIPFVVTRNQSLSGPQLEYQPAAIFRDKQTKLETSA